MKIAFYIQPQASKSEVVGLHQGSDNKTAVKIKIKAPPVDGAANEELIHFLSKYLKLKKNQITIKSGHTGRHKIIKFTDVDEQEVKIKLGL